MTVQDVVADLFDAIAVSPTRAGGDDGAAGEASGERDHTQVSLAIEPQEAAALGALAKRFEVDEQALWVGGWALMLARLAGARAARVAVEAGTFEVATPAEGEVAAWLVAVHQQLAAGKTSSGAAASGWRQAENAESPESPAPGASASSDGPALIWTRDAGGARASFDPSRIDRGNAARLCQLYGLVLRQLAAAAGAASFDLAQLSPLSSEERTLVLHTWNQTDVRHRPEATVHGLFREAAAAHPERLALLWDDGRLTYRELDRASDALAERLIAAGVSTDEPVALVLPRSPEAVIAALAILKAGGAYLPLDPDYPAERLAFAVGDAGATVLVTHRARLGSLGALALRTVFVDDDAGERAASSSSSESATSATSAAAGRFERATPRTRAYVMYTSGSTGVPKGVQIEHRSILRLVGDVRYVQLDEHTRFLHAAPLGFDASTLELWGPLLHGGAVVVYKDAIPTGPGLARAIARHGVTSAWLTAALFNSVIDDDPRHLAGLRQLFTGGEALSPSHVRRALAALPETELVNGYGPTECTTFVTTYPIPRDTPADARAIPIGFPIADTQLYVLDPAGQPVPVGIVGELFVGGLGVARGYLARPELDAERFVEDPFTGEGRLYRTGDRVRWRQDGALDFVGRVDNQVKLRGFRIELGEIEARLAEETAVAACAVIVRDDGPTGKRLVAYVVPAPAAQLSAPALRNALARKLPDFMVPSTYVELASLPVTANGKLDRAALPAPSNHRPELAAPYRAPAGEREAAICTVFAELLGLDRVGSLDGFFELGGNSLLSVRLLARLREAGLPEVSTATFFAAPTPAALARAMAGDQARPAATASRRRAARSDEPIAIVGMAGRFPGAADVEAFWKNLCDGVESIRYFSAAELDPSIPAAVAADPAYVAARGVLDDVELFDAGFFGISPLEAQLMDPQHRHFLEVAWTALEHAGHTPEQAPGPIGVFGGMYNATYFQRHLMPRPDVTSRMGELQVMLGNEKDYVTTRVAHKLGLTGPAVSVHTACSTSLVAAAMAMDSLRNGSCDLALAGGVAITCPPASGYLFQEGSMASPDGHTRTFDAKAGGTVFSDGVAVVVLRRLSDALADGDQVYAVLLGAAVNNDGAERASFTAPSPEGQALVIAAAHDAAGVDPRSISYIEAHGTATPLGDPIEIEGLTRAFARHTQDRGFCAIGSLKSNVGHMVIAAGAASLIKAALALHRKTLPPSINFTAPSPKIDFERTPFRVQRELAPWPAQAEGAPRRAAVSSFGFGGTNCHAVLEEAPPAVPSSAGHRPVELFAISARTAPALAEASTRLTRYLQELPAGDAATAQLRDVAHTLQIGRRGFSHRRFVVAGTAAEAARLLTTPDAARCGSRELGAELPEVGFLCTGQGSQYPRMGAALYDSEPTFRAAYDDCCTIIESITGEDPRRLFFSSDPQALTPTSVTQPALFCLEYSLAQLWMSWGVVPTALIGHSIGEFVCAAIAEVMSLSDILGLVVERGRLMQAQPAGSMLSVRLPAAELSPHLPAGVVIAAENAPGLCVASGPTERIARLEAELGAKEITARRLVTSHAFHSPMMEPVIEPMAARLAKLQLSPPKIPIFSTVTASWLTAAQAQSVRYWAEHLRLPVRFGPAAAGVLADRRRVLIELGPRGTLSALARQALPDSQASAGAGKAKRLPVAVPSLGDAVEKEHESVTAALGQLWAMGASIDWAGYRDGERRRRLPLPTYPFQRQRHWVEAPAAGAAAVSSITSGAAPAATVAATVAAPTAPIFAPPSFVLPGAPGFAAAPFAPSLPASPVLPAPDLVMSPAQNAAARRSRLLASVCELVEEVSGADVSDADPQTPWLELGLDSLTLTQLAIQVQRAHSLKVSFRQVMEEFPSIAALAAMLDERLPPDPEDVAATGSAPAPPAASATAPTQQMPVVYPPQPMIPAMPPMPAMSLGAGGEQPFVRQVIEHQLALMQQQLAVLAGAPAYAPALAAPQPQAQPAAAPIAAKAAAAPAASAAPAPAAPPAPPVSAIAAKPVAKNEDEPAAGPVAYDVKKAFGAIARIHTQADELSPHQRARLDALITRYCERTRKSKEYTQKHRARMADPRVVNGFRPLTKELTYSIVVERSRGSRLWDLDGNEYIDVLNGFGMNLFGWQPDFLREAVHRQVDLGYEIGPQHVLAGECAELFCDITGADRAAFCNTGSEAVMGCMRVARTVTGRSLIVAFTGAYHGIFDEVIVRGTRKLKSIPAAPGIMPSASQNILILDYGTPESLEIIRSRAHELAAVVAEPVQSRRPDFAPVEFLREVRAITEEAGALLIFDEVVTGFRAHLRGAQGLFDIKADLASYGKVVGGGFSIGVVAGKRQFMDALDGGHWQYGDASIPTVGVTYFAGTFVRHPLALATAKAALLHMQEAGPSLQERLTAKTAAMVAEINAFMVEIGAPLKLNTFASLWRNAFTEDLPYADLIYAMIRDRGIHIADNFPCFLTTSHSDEDIAKIVAAYKAAALEMQASGFFPAGKLRFDSDLDDDTSVAALPLAAAGLAALAAAPSTEPQREVWLADKLGPEASLAYNESICLHLRGELDVAALRHAVRELPRRHDALRATFSADGLVVRSPDIAELGDARDAAELLQLDVPLTDLSELPDDERRHRFDELAARHVEETFDLERGPLVRAELVKLAADHHVLIFTGHHIVLDGWSYWIIVKDLAALYGLATGSRTAKLGAAPSFIAYARDVAARANSPEVTANERWWIDRFAGGVPTLDLPTDRPRPAVRTTRSSREDHLLPAELVAGAKKAGAALGASLFATLLAAFDALLHRLSGATELVVGIPAAGQNAEGLEGLVGHCVNMLPLRAEVSRADRFADLVRATRRVMLDAFDHQDVTFGRVLQGLPIARDPSRLPLIPVMFNIDQALGGEAYALPGLALELTANARRHETFELFINAVDTGAGMRLECQYNADLFDAATIRRWLAAYELLLRSAVADMQQPIARLPLVTDADRRALSLWNQTETPFPQERRVEELVFATARQQPDAVAVRIADDSADDSAAGERTLSYGQLAASAAAVAAALRAAGVKPGSRVGLCTDRDEHLLASLFGVLAAGAAYVPLDPSFPAERLAFMVKDAGVSVIATTKAVAERLALPSASGPLGHARRVLVDELAPASGALPSPTDRPPALGGTDAVAYVIYTSGSTGAPKGVQVQHRAVVNFLTSMARTPGMAPGDRIAAVTTLAFDIAVLELILPLVVGAELQLVRREQAIDGHALRALVEDNGVTLMQATPATWRLLLAAGWTGSPTFRALCGGEALDRELAAQLAPRVGQLWNLYGPTETTVWSTAQLITDPARVAIGAPIANTTVYVLDEDLQQVPVGVVGELYIGGDGVTIGYLDRPELTKERFLPDPFRLAAGARMYRTGDLGRWRMQADGRGVLECLGRTDFQVKLRGYRIELGEIEIALARHPAIAQAVVVTREERPGDVRLVGYAVPRPGAELPTDDVLREHLGRTLPDYMVPQRFVSLPVLPLTGSGKINRKALPAPSGPATAGDGPQVLPRTPTEELVARAYQEALSLPRLSIHDDFFALGGHSLLVAQMTAQLSRQLSRTVPMRVAFEHTTVAKLAAWLDGQRRTDVVALPKIPRRAEAAAGGASPAPLSLMQQRVWYLDQLQLGRTVFNVPSAHRLRGNLDRDALQRAFTEMCRRQDVLRTIIGTVGDAPAQIVLERVDTDIPLEDLSELPDGLRQATLARRLEEEIARPFDLSRPPLFRVRLFKLSGAPDNQEHVLYFMTHHAIWDGWSFDLFYEEMSELYDAYRRGQEPTRAAPTISYGDFSVWHREWLAGPELTRQLDHWRAKLSGAPDALDLPTDLPRPPQMSGDGGTEWLSIPPATAEALRAAGLREGATLFMTLLGAWTVLLHQLTRQREVIVGTPVRGRILPELEKMMGFFVNALPLRLAVDPKASFLELLRKVRGETVEAFGAQDVPFEHLVRVLDVRRDESRFPIYQAFFSYQDARQRPPRWGNLAHNNIPVFQPSAAQDVALWFLDGVDGVVGGLNYNTDILEPATAARYKQRFLALLEAIAADPGRSVQSLLAITDDEQATLREWNRTAAALPEPQTLQAMLAPLGSHGARAAIAFGDEAISYAELAARRDRVAAAISARGAGRGDIVAILLQRTPLMMAALHGAIAAGVTYLPLDPGFPAERLAFMLADSGAKLVLTDAGDVGDVPGGAYAPLGITAERVLRVDQLLQSSPASGDDGVAPKVPITALGLPVAQPEDAAYLIYTSGSTGKPKGVKVPQRAVANFLASMRSAPGLAEGDRLLAVTTLSFDIAVLELLLPPVVGAELILATREQAIDGHALRALLEHHRATVMQATPATWRMLVEAGWRGGGGFRALCGGEALPPELAEALLERTAELWNMYGPTETTVWSTCGRVVAGQGTITIGRPIANTSVWILDDAGAPTPIGVPGEIWIGGAGVALGYHQRPELTAERFIKDPFADPASGNATAAPLLYRTGDVGRWRADGQLQHLGRTDFQVKVRGYRIELGEIEVALARHSRVAQAAVLARPGPGGEQRLVAYVVGREGAAPEAAELREHLRQHLPDYMVPALFVPLPQFPLTPNGKLDRRALPAPAEVSQGSSVSFSAPQTTSEQLVAAVWRELLGVERIAVKDNFLDLGGHSLLIMQAIAKLEARTGKRISPRTFIFQTLEQIAREYDDVPPPPAPSPPSPRGSRPAQPQQPTSRLGRLLKALKS
jgi:amino acid adenylation domain-containing protein